MNTAERLQLVLAAANSIGAWDWDVASGLVTADARVCEFYGVDPVLGAAGAPASEYERRIHPDDIELFRQTIGTAVDTGKAFTAEYRVQQPDGSMRWVSAQARCVAGPNGASQRFIGVALDITERKAAEAALRESEERFRLVAESAPVMLWMGDQHGQCLYLNRALRNFWGVSETDVATFDWNTTIHPEDRDALFRPFGEAMRTQTAFSVEARYRCAIDGAYRLLNTQAQPRFGANGAFLGMIGVNVDVTETRRSDAALQSLNANLEAQVTERTAELRASINRLRSTFETSYIYQGYMTRDGTLLDANAASLAGIQARLEDVVGRPFWQTPWFTGTGGMPETVQGAVKAAANGQAVQTTIAVKLPVGERVFEFALRPVKNERGEVMAIIPEAVDITDRVKAEEQLRQAQKMEAIGQLTGGIAHDFNNMMAVVIGALNLLQRRLAQGNTDVTRYIDAATEGATRAAALTQRLLAFSRQQALAPEPIDANRMVADMSELLIRTLGEQIKVETVLAAGLWRTHADPLQLENAILNLAVNARDAMTDGGRLTIETANTHVDDDVARECQIVAGQYVMIAITDTGSGMSPEIMAQAFDPFFTTKGVGAGTGLGLSQVFGFVRQSGGHVKLYSEIGVGTTVKVYLPRFLGESVPAAPKRPPAAALRGDPNEIVLVVEDEDRVRSYSVEALRELGYSVAQAASGAEALAMIESGQPATLLFTDVIMPGMTGRKLADLAVQKLPKLKVLFTTGYERNAIVHNAVLEPGTHFLPKPFGIEQLAAKVRDVLDA